MFERFNAQARTVVVAAQEQARMFGHDYIGTEHLLLGLLSGDSVAARVLADAGVTAEAIGQSIASMVGTNDPLTVSGHIPFTPRAKKVLELALRQALELGHNHIGTEHILLGIVQEGDGLGAALLAERGLDDEALRGRVLQALGIAPDAPPAGPLGMRFFRRRWPGAPGATRAQVPTTNRTPGLAQMIGRAQFHAGGQPIGTQHVLWAMAESTDTAAQRVLQRCGIDCDSLAIAAASVDASGTSDAIAPAVQVETSNGAVTLRFADPETAARLAGLDGDDLTRAVVELLGGRSWATWPPADEEPSGEG